MDCRCCHHCCTWWAWFQQPAPPTSHLFVHFRLFRSDAQPRWRRLSTPTLSSKNALQKPTDDVTDTTSMFFYSLCVKPRSFFINSILYRVRVKLTCEGHFCYFFCYTYINSSNPLQLFLCVPSASVTKVKKSRIITINTRFLKNL